MTDPDDSSIPPPESPQAHTTLHVQRAIHGDVASLEWLVTHLNPLLLAHAEYRLGPQLRRYHDPEDLVNDAWVVAFPRLADLATREGRHTPVLLRFLTTTLLFRINELARKHLRGGRRAIPRTDEEAISSRDLPAATSGAITRAVRREEQEALSSCLGKLDEQDREILLLRGIEQQPYKTISAVLGITPAAATMRYHRALKRLREKLPSSVFDELIDD